jgi:hypothetical protein
MAAFQNALIGGTGAYRSAQEMGLLQEQRRAQAAAAEQARQLQAMRLIQEMSQDQRPTEVQAATAMYPGLPVGDAMSRYFAAKGGPESGRPVQVMGPNGPMWMKPSEAYGQPAVNSQWGGSISYDDQGRPVVSFGEGAGGAMTKPTTTAIEKDILQYSQELSQVRQAIRDFQPKFSTAGGKWEQLWSGLKDKAGTLTNPADKEAYQDYVDYRATLGKTVAERIKAMAGTAMTAQEAERQMVYLPDLGSDVPFTGDGPTQTAQKLKTLDRNLTAAQARLYYVKQHGLTIDKVPLDRMPALMNERGDAIAAQIRQAKPGISEDEMGREVRSRLAYEFGLMQ